MIRRLLLLLAGAFAATALLAVPGAAQEDERPVVVLDIRRPVDQRLMDWLVESIEAGDAHLYVLQVDSPGIASGDPGRLFSVLAGSDRSVPVVAWVGPAPAVAHGGVACLLAVADHGAAAPGTRLGLLDPVVAGESGAECPATVEADLRSRAVEVDAPIPGVVGEVVPTIGQLIVGLDGMTLGGDDGDRWTIDTAEAGAITRPVEFRKPGLWDRFLRLASPPEAAFFFLVAGIALATFEFYAAGVGVTAVVAALSLFLSGYGMAILPVRWPSVAATVLGLLLYTWDFQRGRVGLRSLLGTAALLAGGLTFTAASPQFGPVWWIVVVVVVGAASFYGIALTTIARSRFSTRTIGRSHLVGRKGTAETDLTPDGVVAVDGARWQGRSHREAGIRAGDPVTVASVSGIVLEVERASNGRARD